MPKPFGELALIERIRAGAGPLPRGIALGIGDDCAILRPPRGHEILLTTDFSLEGRHFRRDWHTAESAGHRCLARGLSDLAAMGAQPIAAFLSLALPGEMLSTRTGWRWVDGFFRGLHGLGDRLGVTLAGGDTAESPGDAVLADIVLVGSAPAGRALRRSGGSAGDLLYVTGALGGAAAELETLAGRRANPTSGVKPPDMGHPSRHPQMFPEPRVAVGLALLRRRLASAAIDLSDGLSTDLAHLCKASGVSAEVAESALPLHSLAAAHPHAEALRLALSGGEDYELLFAARPEVKMPRSIAGVPVTRIGRLTESSKRRVTLVRADGRREPLRPAGWEHFRSPGADHGNE